jgi:hypothetical protein
MGEPTDATEQTLRAQIEAAFARAPAPEPDEMLLDAYAGSDDAQEMADAFRGKHWTELPLAELFRHREMVIALGAAAYRAYLPAYLTASLTDHAHYGPDIREYLLFWLRPLSDDTLDVTTTRERLSLLDEGQRSAVASVLAHLATRWEMEEAGEILRSWT